MGEVLQLPVEVYHESVSELALAAGAEHLVMLGAQPTAVLAEVIPLFPERPSVVEYCIPATRLDFLNPIKEAAHQAAVATITQRREALIAGDFDVAPLPIDGLNTASKLRAVEDTFGKNSSEAELVEQGLDRDCERKLAEAKTANTYRYYPVTVTQHDRTADKLFADGLCVDEMHDNGLTPLGEAEEQARRVHDKAIFEVKKALLRSDLADEVGILHVSGCPKYAHESYQRNPKGTHGGYAPAVDKWMFGFDTFNHEKGEIYHEQVGVPGTFYSDEIVNWAFQTIGATRSGEILDRTELYGTTPIVRKEAFSEVMGFVAMLDQKASEVTGRNVFMGEEVPADHPKDYQAVKQAALQEEQANTKQAAELKAYIKQLEEEGIEHGFGTHLVEKFIRDKLLEEAEDNPELAAQAFDSETHKGFVQAKQLRTQGLIEEANTVLEATKLNAPAAVSCGAGTCGLRELKYNEKDISAKKALRVKAGESVVKDEERPCGNCGKIEVYWAFKSTGKPRGVCINCGHKNFKGNDEKSAAKAQKPQKFTLYSNEKQTAFELVA